MSALRKVGNPPNPYSGMAVEWEELPPPPQLEIFEEEAKSVISKNDSPDVGFRYSVNPYRGCFHGCSYCYARPSHQYLDFGAGTDFERKLIVKVNAPERLHEEFMKPSWKGEMVVFSGNTDCYQPLEGRYELTRKLLQVCLKFRNPVSIITKGTLIQRDIDVLRELNEQTYLHVTVSLSFSDNQMCRLIEPYTPVPSTRLKVIEALHRAGISVGLGVAPVIPGLNDTQIPDLLNRAKEAGASSAFMTLLRLPAEVAPVFTERLRENFPDRAEKVLHTIRKMKDGALNRSEFGKRMSGDGKEWEAIRWIFERSCERVGFVKDDDPISEARALEKRSTFRRPSAQLSLFS